MKVLGRRDGGDDGRSEKTSKIFADGRTDDGRTTDGRRSDVWSRLTMSPMWIYECGYTGGRTERFRTDGRTDGRVTEIPEGGFAPPDPPTAS